MAIYLTVCADITSGEAQKGRVEPNKLVLAGLTGSEQLIWRPSEDNPGLVIDDVKFQGGNAPFTPAASQPSTGEYVGYWETNPKDQTWNYDVFVRNELAEEILGLEWAGDIDPEVENGPEPPGG